MYSKVYSAAIRGVSMEIVSVETDVSDGLPSFEMVGLLNSEVKDILIFMKPLVCSSRSSW